MKLRDATTADAARLDTLLTRLIHDEVQYDSNLNGSYVVTDNYRDCIGLEGHKLLLIEDGGEIVRFFIWLSLRNSRHACKTDCDSRCVVR